MKKLVLAIAILGALVFGNGPARAQNCTAFQTLPGPVYATPSWDQQLLSYVRFVCLLNWNNEAVLDRETGLVWQRAPVQQGIHQNWSDAVRECYNANIGGRGGWRLPAPEEMMSLVDFTQSNPALPPGHPFQGVVPNGRYWTASMFQTRTDTTPSRAIVLEVGPGRVGAELTADPQDVWCVRGGSHVRTIIAAPPV